MKVAQLEGAKRVYFVNGDKLSKYLRLKIYILQKQTETTTSISSGEFFCCVHVLSTEIFTSSIYRTRSFMVVTLIFPQTPNFAEFDGQY